MKQGHFGWSSSARETKVHPNPSPEALAHAVETGDYADLWSSLEGYAMKVATKHFYKSQLYDFFDEDELLSLCYDALVRCAPLFKPGRVQFKTWLWKSILLALNACRERSLYRRRRYIMFSHPVKAVGIEISGDANPYSEVPLGGVFASTDNFTQRHNLEKPPVSPIDVSGILGLLTPRSAQMMRLYFMEGRSFGAIGDLLGVKGCTVDRTVERAKKKIRNTLTKEEAHALCRL